MSNTIRKLGLGGGILATLVGILLGTSAHTFVVAEGGSYLSDEPKSCMNCHVMREQYDGWQKAAHHAYATCNDCHTPHDFVRKYLTKLDHGWRHSKGFTLNDFHEPIRITPKDLLDVRENCIRCHTGLVASIADPAHASLRTPHAASASSPSEGVERVGGGFAETADCVHCHAEVGHGPAR